MAAYALLAEVSDRRGMLSDLTRVLADHHANITYDDIHVVGEPVAYIYFDFTVDEPSIEPILTHMRQVDGVRLVEETPNFARIYGKRIIVIGGGAQVGFVAMGAITEADRHNIRGERISIDTIPPVCALELSDAARATARLPRAKMLVLAGSIMGGAITEAVKEVQSYGLRLISLNQAGSVPDAADLVVSDPVQAGVMAVMAVADTAKFDLMKQLKRRY